VPGRQVARDATRLLAEMGGDEDTVLASVWIHDRFQPQYHGTDHAAKAAEWARQNLAALGFPGEKVDVDQFYFDISRHWARERLNTQRAFYEALAHEIGM
jgi:HD superfamily phosphodiesterase